jgi:hypothetical protein
LIISIIENQGLSSAREKLLESIATVLVIVSVFGVESGRQVGDASDPLLLISCSAESYSKQ